MARLRLFIFCCLLGTAPAALLGQSVAFVDAAGQPASEYLEVTPAYVRVVDPGANQNGFIAESVTVQLTTAVWSDQEYLTLQETGPGSGIFEGSIPLRSAGPIVPGNGYLETGIASGPPIHYDTITASYLDSGSTPRSATASTVDYHVWFLDASGNVVTSYVPGSGSQAHIRIEEHAYNNPSFVNHLYTELTSSNGDHEVIDITETGSDTSIFEGSIPLEFAAATPDDGRLQAVGGGQISADRFSPWFPAPVYAQIEAASLQIVNAQGQPVDEILENDTVHVRVNSPGDNVNPAAVDTVSVTIQSQHAGDQETVTLTETGPSTGLFEGSIPLRYAYFADPGDGFLETAYLLNPQHEEIQATFGSYSANAHTVGARLSFVGLRDQPVTSYGLRSLVRVKVEDLVDNSPGQIDTINLLLRSPTSNDLEAVELTETEANSGVFYGSMPSLETSGSSFDGVLWVEAGQTATAEFNGWTGQYQAQVSFSSNYVPVVQNESLQTEQGGQAYVRVLDNDYDPEGGPISLAALSQGAKGEVAVSPYGYVYYTPNPGTSGTDTFTYVVADEQGGEALGTVTVLVNGAPVANPDTASVDEDGSVEIQVLANDSDPENNPLSVGSYTNPAHGTLVMGPDQTTVIYTPAADFHGTDTFEYLAVDSNGANASATVTVNVNSINDPPVVNDDTAVLSEDSSLALRLLDNDWDADGDTLHITSVTQPSQGTAVINPDWTVTYTPPPNFYGRVTFSYTADDGNGGTANATVTVLVGAVNDLPVANPDTATVAEDGTVTITVLANDTDVDNDVLAVTLVSQGAHGTVVLNPNSTVRYTPAANYNGSDSFTYRIEDGHTNGRATGTVTVTVTPVNDPPVANADSATVAEDGAIDITVLGNDTDIDGNTLSVSSVMQGAHGTVAINPDKTVKYTPAANYNGSDSFTYTISDGNGGTSTAAVTVTVSSVNDAPAANADSATVVEDGTVDVTVLGNDTDPEGDTLSVSAVTQGTHGAVTINPDKTVRYTPAANYNGSDSFTYTASDGNGGTSTATVAITVTAVNDAPAASADSATVAEDGSVNITVLGNDTDPEGDTLTVSAVTQGSHGAVVINPDKTVKYTPAANYNGSDSFTYTASDGNGGTSTATVTITVTPVNDAPIASSDSATVAEDGTVNITVLGNDTDPEGDALSVSSVTQGAHGTVVINPDKTVKYTPAANYNGSDSFSYTASDGNGGSSTATVTITVTPVNDAPVANADSATVAEDGTVNITVLGNDTDPEGNILSVSAVTQAAHGAVVINPDKTVRYTPAANYNGSDSFTYTISDGNGGTASAAVSINVTSINDAPVAVNDTATAGSGSAITIPVLANDADIDGPSLSVSSVTQGAHGTVAINAGQTISYTASLYIGTDTFTYTVSDGAGGTATATVTVTITTPSRVTTGLQARYDFNEGSGSTVNDTSGVGTPLNLTIASPSSVSWVSGGLSVNTATSIATPGAASKINSAAQSSNAITVEAWIQPVSLTLTGPARILTLTKNASQRNLVFGQVSNQYQTQLKTSTGTPTLSSPAASLTLNLTHVVYTRDASGAAVYYINGAQAASQSTTGTFSAWGTDHKLILSDSSWRGTYYLMAVYSRALSATEVQQNYLAGANGN